MTAIRAPAEITVFSGAFASQPLVFAHLLDEAAGLDLDHVEVCQGSGLRARLGGYFDPETVTKILVALEDDDTCVLFLPKAGTFEGSARLRTLGVFPGTLLRAAP
ncbi:MAG: hypothetical protein QNI90_17320 [Dinoroseobacter sp.]|nr:hypothetical protein [Dinoroseobacter sp.]MDJ0995341.1 hypothetical protein [Dinoroseobacter sp.]